MNESATSDGWDWNRMKDGGSSEPGDKPRLLMIERSTGTTPIAITLLEDRFDLVRAKSVARAMSLIRDQDFVGVFLEKALLPAARSAGGLLQSDEVLASIADGVAVVEVGDLRICWCNNSFNQFLDSSITEPIGVRFLSALGLPEAMGVGSEARVFQEAIERGTTTTVVLRIQANRWLRVEVTPRLNQTDSAHLIVLAREVTAEVLREQKINAIHKAGEELADLRPDELADMSVEDRADLLKENIGRHMKDLLGWDYFEIRLLDNATGRLVPLLAEGLAQEAMERELLARKEGHGITGYVASTGESYLCRDTVNDPIYFEGAQGAHSSLTVPLMDHGAIVGTLNVESMHVNAFDDIDRQFLEIYARNVANALRTLQLLEAEQILAANNMINAVRSELALPIDQILNDASTVLERYVGHDEEIVHRLRDVIFHARAIRKLVDKAGATVLPEPARRHNQAKPKSLEGRMILVADPEIDIRQKVHQILGQEGGSIETASDAYQAIALARQSAYSLAFVDIRLPDLPGFETLCKLREIQPDLPIVFITGYGYDPTHAIPKSRPLGLKHVLYKPFRPERLLEVVRLGLTDPDPTSPLSNLSGSTEEKAAKS